jgi:hypothetical protein
VCLQSLGVSDTSEMAKRRSSIDLADDGTSGRAKRKPYVDLTTEDDGEHTYINPVREQVYGNASHEDYQKSRVRKEGGDPRPKKEKRSRDPTETSRKKNRNRVRWKAGR